MANGQEKEIKLVSTPAGRKKLLQLPLVKEKLIAGSRHELALVNRYYDTRDQKLTRTGMAYRIRRTNGKAFEATVKTRGETVNGFSARQEYTVQLEKEQPVLAGFAPQMDEKLQTLLTEDELLPLFTVEFTRKVALLQLTKSTVVEVAVDTGSIQAGDSTEPIEEIELEIKKGREKDLLRFTAALSREIPLLPEERSKFQRGLALLTPDRGLWQKQARYSCEAGMPPEGAWRGLVAASLGGALDQLEQRRRDPEGFSLEEYQEQLAACRGLWQLGEDFLSGTSWQKGNTILQGLLKLPFDQQALPEEKRLEDLLARQEGQPLQEAAQWLKRQGAELEQQGSRYYAQAAAAGLWQLLYLSTLAVENQEVQHLGDLRTRYWNKWQQEARLLSESGNPSPLAARENMALLSGLLVLEEALSGTLGKKKLVKAGKAYQAAWYKVCRTCAQIAAYQAGAQKERVRRLGFALCYAAGWESAGVEKQLKKAEKAGKALRKEIQRHAEISLG